MFFGHVLLLSTQVNVEQGHSLLRVSLVSVLSPIQRGVDSVTSTIWGVWDRYIFLRGVYEENESLKKEVSRLEQTLWLEQDYVASYHRLSKALRLADRFSYEPIVAEVIGVDASLWFHTVTVNRGRDRGVQLNAPVVGSSGLIGRVVAVGSEVAQIQLITDRDASVGVLLSRTRTRGLVGGTGLQNRPLGVTLKYVSNLEDVLVGDPIITSGIDGIYHKGLVVGKVASVRDGPNLFKNITVELSANIDRLEEVFVLPAVDVSHITEYVE